MKILYLTTDTVHHRYVLEKLKGAFHEVVMVAEDPVNFFSFKVFKKKFKQFCRGCSFKEFIYNFPFVRLGMYDGLRNSFERKLFNVKSDHPVFLHLENINMLISHQLLNQGWDMVLVFGTRKIEPALVRNFSSRNIPMVNVHCAVLPYIRGLESDVWSLFRRKWHEIGVTIHFVEENLDTGRIIAQSLTDVKKAAFPWQIRGFSTRKAADMILENISLVTTKPCESFTANSWKKDSEYFSFPGIIVQLGAFINFYIRKLSV